MRCTVILMRRRRKRDDWTLEEMHLLKSKYATHGVLALSRMLKRTEEDISKKAEVLGVAAGGIRGWVPVRALATTVDRPYHRVRAKALRSGFSRKLPNNVLVVPEAWADAYVKSIERGEQADELINHYYDVTKVARIFGVKPITIYQWLYGNNVEGSLILKSINVVVTSDKHKRQYLFEPYAVEREAKKYRDRNNRS
jgi:hypothetical protein